MKRLALTALAIASTALSGAGLANDNYQESNQFSGYQNGSAYVNGTNAVRYDNARVLSVDPIIDQYYRQPRRECWVKPARNYNQYNNSGYQNNYNNTYHQNNGSSLNAGAIIGGVVGAVVGNKVSDGNVAATAVGALAGYAIARQVQHKQVYDNHYSAANYNYQNYPNNQYNNGYQNYNGYATAPNGQLHCRMVNDGHYSYGYQNDQGDRYDRERYVNENYQDRYDHNRDDHRYDDARVTGYRVRFEYHGQVYNTVTDYHPGNSIRVRVDVVADNRDNRYTTEPEYARY